jgi:hypothetical protein
MTTYAVYGSTLASAVEFPELARATGASAPRWHFEITDALAPMPDAVELGAELIYADVHARLYAHRGGHRITVDDTGAYDLSPDGRIRCQPIPGAWPDFVRAHCVGRVLATAIYLDGWLPLHGSAVELEDGVVAFLAPKGFGKSSLALALNQAGAPLVTDDTLPVEPTMPPRAWPGVHNLRVREDSLEALDVSSAGETTREGKRMFHASHTGRVLVTPRPFAAIYILGRTVDGAPDTGVRRVPFSPTVAALAVVAHVKIGRMLGTDAAATMLERVANIVRMVPVHRLSIPQDLSRFPEAVEQLFAWHGRPS